MFEIIQLLRSVEDAMTAAEMAGALEVTKRTIYRDIAELQATGVPIEGEAGVGYIMRPGFDLPPLMFSAEELEAIAVGLALLRRTGDGGLLAAANRVSAKINEVLLDGDLDASLYVSGWNDIPETRVDLGMIREAIREEERLRITYADASGETTERTIKPLSLVYYVEAIVLGGWCELRHDLRSFRADRISACEPTGAHFRGEGEALRQRWRAKQKLP